MPAGGPDCAGKPRHAPVAAGWCELRYYTRARTHVHTHTNHLYLSSSTVTETPLPTPTQMTETFIYRKTQYTSTNRTPPPPTHTHALMTSQWHNSDTLSLVTGLYSQKHQTHSHVPIHKFRVQIQTLTHTAGETVNYMGGTSAQFVGNQVLKYSHKDTQRHTHTPIYSTESSEITQQHNRGTNQP